MNRYSSGQIGWHARDDVGTENDDYYSASANDNAWHNVVIVRESASTYKTYFDGSLQGTDSATTIGTMTPDHDGIGVYNGRYGLEYYFDGIIDDVKIYDYALTSTEVSNIYNGI